MPKQSHVPGLTARRLRDGSTSWHWKASPRLRRAGWSNLALGSDLVTATAAAIARNEEVAAFERRGPAAGGPPRPRTFAEGIAAYRADPAFTSLKPKSRAEYGTRLRQLQLWADDGRLPIRHLTRDMCIDLRNVLVRDGRAYRTAAILRVLRILCAFFASQGWLLVNPAKELDVPEPPARRHRVAVEQLPGLLAAAADLGLPHIALAAALGFYTMQREADLLATSAFRLKPITDLSADARRALAGPDGKVLALWLEQGKTGTPVVVPLTPAHRVAIEETLAAARADGVADASLFLKNGRKVQEWTLQRDFRAACAHAAATARQRQEHDLAAAYEGLQFRDLRRSGMCWMRELAVPVALIATISGHSIEKTQKILETYLPRDPRAAAEAMALAVTRQAQRDADAAAESEAL